MGLWEFIAWPAIIFCLVRGAFDLRQRRYAWGVIGVACGLILLLTPIPGHVVKYDLPRPQQG